MFFRPILNHAPPLLATSHHQSQPQVESFVLVEALKERKTECVKFIVLIKHHKHSIIAY